MNSHPENPFWASILSNPDDSLPRLVFADWLEENGEIDRAYQLRLTNGFSKIVDGGGDGVGDGGDGVGDGGGYGGGGDGYGGGGGDGSGGDGSGVGGVGGGVGGGEEIKFFYGDFVMENGFYLLYYPTGYYPLVQVGYVEIKGAELIMYGRRVVANSGIGPDWEGLADKGPDTATLHDAAKRPVSIPRQCIGHQLNMEKWAKALPEAIEASKRFIT